MTLPVVLLGLYVGLFLLSLVLVSWLGQLSAQTEAARRVTIAAERAALQQLIEPAKVAAVGLALISLVGGLSTYKSHGPTLLVVAASFVGPSLILAVIILAARSLMRGSTQIISSSGVDTRVSHCGRTTAAAVALSESVVSLVLLGTFNWTSQSYEAPVALRLVLLMAASLAVIAVAFGRGAASSAMSCQTTEGEVGPHPGSLALLVSGAFQTPLLRLLMLASLSVLGQCALLVSVEGANDNAELWLYPHLLKMLAVVALLFGASGVRSAEDEASSAGWVRGGLVALVLLVAGAWSLGGKLPGTWAQSVPSGLSFLFLAVPFAAWAHRSEGPGSNKSWVSGILRRVPSALVFFGLIMVLVLSVAFLPEKAVLPAPSLFQVLIAGGLCLAPLSMVWLLGRDLHQSAVHAADLSYMPRTTTDSAPSDRVADMPALLGITIIACILGGIYLTPDSSISAAGLISHLGMFAGALTLMALVLSLRKSSDTKAVLIERLVQEHQDHVGQAAKLNLAEAIDSCRTAATGGWSWVCLTLLPALVVLLLHFFLPNAALRQLTLGLAGGAAFLGLAFDWMLTSEKKAGLRTLGALSSVLCLSQTIWLVALSVHMP